MSEHQKMKLPLDQINRDWTKGNCYMAALEFMKDFPGLVEEGVFDAQSEAVLVHGIISLNGKKIEHAWVELGDVVLDNSNNNSLRVAKRSYTDLYSAEPVKKFSRDEADAILQAAQLPDGTFGSLNWSELSNEKIQNCVEKYDPETSPFAKNISFSIPADPANRENLKTNQ